MNEFRFVLTLQWAPTQTSIMARTWTGLVGALPGETRGGLYERLVREAMAWAGIAGPVVTLFFALDTDALPGTAPGAVPADEREAGR